MKNGTEARLKAMKTQETLEERYADDLELLRFNQKKLLIAGWPGLKDDVEKAFIAATRKALGRKPRGRPFQRKTPAPSRRRARLDRDVSRVEDLDVPVAAARSAA